MQTLVFNSTEKTAVLQEGFRGTELLNFKNVPTVKVENGYYEVMQKSGENGGVVPVLRVSIANTNNMKKFLLLVLKFVIFNFWFCSTLIGINLLNQKVMWQNYLGVLILVLSLGCVIYYIKKNVGKFMIKVKEYLYNY